MAALPARRSGRTPTVVNPSREFEDIYDRMSQLMNFAFGLIPADQLSFPRAPGSAQDGPSMRARSGQCES
jgi:hypothetical protein